MKTETIDLEDVKDPKRTCGKRCSDSRDCLSMERCRLYKDECHMTCEKIPVPSSRGNFNWIMNIETMVDVFDWYWWNIDWCKYELLKCIGRLKDL